MSENTTQKYRHLNIRGPLSIVRVTPEDLRGDDFNLYIFIGPTGAGKSAFLQSLSPDQKLDISKDSLESVTQEVVRYRVVNMIGKDGWSYVFMDTPGFLDTKLSESRITKMIKDALDSRWSTPASIIYFHPITDIRLGGSKRDAIQLLRAFAKPFGVSKITVVTTMWNHISTPKQIEDANRRFHSLKKDIFTGSDKPFISVTKFQFSQDSALSIMDGPDLGGWLHDRGLGPGKTDFEYQSLILDNLLERISNTQQQLQLLAEDRRNATTPGEEDLRLFQVVVRDEKVALDTLQLLLDDLVDIGPTGLAALESLLDACYNADPAACSMPWPQVTFPSSLMPQTPVPPPSPSPSSRSLSARFKGVISPVKRLFKRK